MRSETGVRIIDHRCIDAGLEDAGQFQKVERGVSHLAFLTREFVLVRKGTGIAARCASMVGQVLCGRFLRCKRRVSRRSDAGFFAKLIWVNFNAPLTSRNIFSRSGCDSFGLTSITMRGAQARTSAGESLPLLHQNLRVSLKIQRG